MRKSNLKGNFASQIDIGKVRHTNEDRSLALVNPYGDVMLVVCDGMGGENKGDLAATLCVQTFEERFRDVKRFRTPSGTKHFIKKTLKLANQLVYTEGHTRDCYKDMGTCVSVAIITEKNLVVGQMGDSRCYWINNGKLQQLTNDHTLGMRQFRRGLLKKEEIKTYKHRHVLTNSLGVHKRCANDVDIFEYNNETVFLCSDGLYNNVSETELQNILTGKDKTAQKVNELISLANANGGSDNIAAVLWECNK